MTVKWNKIAGDGPHKPLAFDQILVHLFLLFVFNLTNKILFKPNGTRSTTVDSRYLNFGYLE